MQPAGAPSSQVSPFSWQQHIQISLYVQAACELKRPFPALLAHSANFPQLSRPLAKTPIDARPTDE
jgi:hypothetical protein